ncbi:uncharacterized protein LOC133532468 [Cydia pomonella]|uniref:uncharacterized protein LOC133532468 n=1 Tax=Cydia pomonella TaxID=82600 RepID=UPI002ADE80C8|nr:uncharacterized protein LOC133532468 [Cydia pomonella]
MAFICVFINLNLIVLPGLQSLSGARLLFFNCAYSLADICAKGTSIVEADLTSVFRVVVTLLGGFANSLTANAGKIICDNLLSKTSYYLQQNGYASFSSSVTESIYADIATCNNVAVPWSGSVSN